MLNITITLVTASVLGLMLVWLSARVIGARVRNDSLIGDDNKPDLLWQIRIHGNFVEYSPLFLILLGALEVSGAHSTALMALAGIFVLARLLHVFGMGPDANLKLRQVGMVGTFLTIVAASLYGVYIALF